MNDAIGLDHGAIAELCERYHVRTLSLFGSVLGDEFGPESDVDVLVEFEPGRTPGFFRLHEMEQALGDLLGGRKVDLVTRKFLNRRIRQRILDQAKVIYAKG
jgi:predicted nucleotidyltransferase